MFNTRFALARPPALTYLMVGLLIDFCIDSTRRTWLRVLLYPAYAARLASPSCRCGRPGQRRGIRSRTRRIPVPGGHREAKRELEDASRSALATRNATRIVSSVSICQLPVRFIVGNGRSQPLNSSLNFTSFNLNLVTFYGSA